MMKLDIARRRTSLGPRGLPKAIISRAVYGLGFSMGPHVLHGDELEHGALHHPACPRRLVDFVDFRQH